MGLVRELPAEDIGEFQVMFRMSTLIGDGTSSTARQDGFCDTLPVWTGSRSKKHSITMVFQVKVALRRSPRHTTRPACVGSFTAKFKNAKLKHDAFKES